jgi:hypothetical protein
MKNAKELADQKFKRLEKALENTFSAMSELSDLFTNLRKD